MFIWDFWALLQCYMLHALPVAHPNAEV